MSTDAPPKRAWITLLTRSSYLAGVITLAHTLQQHQTAYPLIVLTTPSLPASSVRALELESAHNPLVKIHPIELLLPPRSQKTTLIASRFEDTWTKLRAFELVDYDALVFLDADITIFKHLDEVFDIRLPSRDWIGANHACVCNLDHDSWAPSDWTAANCAYTPLSHPSALSAPTPVPVSSDTPGKPTHRLLNSGMFLFHPSAPLWEAMLQEFNTTPLLSSFQFPDQDFLAHFFRDRWMSLGWQYNSLKTMRYWHENIWRDEEVRALHYIVDKPWQRRIARDGISGHLGRDGVTHGWWWEVWEEWIERRRGEGADELVEIMEGVVAEALDEERERRQVEEDKEHGWPLPVPEHPGQVVREGQFHRYGVEGKEEEKSGKVVGQGLRARRPGEYGHGRVVHAHNGHAAS
ncbi:MAG: hypothetical protein LQ347_007013 [Umbilicaria vellea]|nr:MAG: hypothetical protein LQ347_007013 [Umbilicaria vellea]